MNRNLKIGLALVVASYSEWLLPHQWSLTHHFLAGFPLTFAVAFFVFGVIFLCEGIIQKVGGVSLMGLMRGRSRGWRVGFWLTAAVTGLSLEVCGQWLGKLWYYAYYPTWFYWPALVPSFILYWVLITETYLAAKALLDHLTRKSKLGTGPVHDSDAESYIFGGVGALGAGLFLFGLVRIGIMYRLEAGGWAFNPYTFSSYAPPLHYVLLCCLGLWLLAEAVLYARQRPSLLRSLFHGYWVPVAAILAASVVLSFVWETQNAVVGYWVYAHWPWPQTQIFGVPLAVLLTWPIHYPFYLALPAVVLPGLAPAFFRRAETRAAGGPMPAGDDAPAPAAHPAAPSQPKPVNKET